jgi:hypothetical protein
MNSHYNQIDTLVAFIGREKWKIIVDAFFANLDISPAPHMNVRSWILKNQNVGISIHPDNHAHFSRMFNECYVDWDYLEIELGFLLQNQVRYTLSELFVWSQTEGYLSPNCGYGFQKR